MKILVIDNYDSFTYNLVHLLEKVCDAEICVFRNDKINLDAIAGYDKIVLSPGPGLPSEAGLLLPIIERYASSKDIFGVCLGLQAIGEAFGATLKNLQQVYHGVATPLINIKDKALFKDCPSTFKVARYHSWVVDWRGLPACLEITAEDEEGNIMALKHTTYRVSGVQFHPESILSEYGEKIIHNWISKT